MTQIVLATTDEQLDSVRGLLRAFVTWHRRRHAEVLPLIDGDSDAEAFEAELAGLPGPYAPPQGALLLALAEGEVAGCVAMRRIDATACEMKRLFVEPRFHGLGVGRALAEAVVHAGAQAGYRVMRLDTSVRQTEALSLYEHLGFRRIEPYYEIAPELRGWLVFLERDLRG